MKARRLLLAACGMVVLLVGRVGRAGEVPAESHPFQNPDLPAEERITNLLSLMTIDEKVACLSTNSGVPRLGVPGTRHVEGLHGLALGGPAQWGGRGRPAQPTTIFPQSIGLGETWDAALIKRVAAVEGYETRYAVQSEKINRGGLVVRAPNADLGRDPRWGRTEECYGEDAFLNGTLVGAFVHGLQGDDPRYWQAVSLMKHFLANSNEDGRIRTSSDFDERLLREYYARPFQRGVEAGSRAFMAAYNAYNAVPCSVHPMLRAMAVNEWGQDGIICTDAGAYRFLVNEFKYVPDAAHAAEACVKAGITQFLDRQADGVNEALAKKLLSEADLDEALRRTFRVVLKLGVLDPAERVPYAKIGRDGEPEPWLGEKHRALARLATQKSIVLLKNRRDLLPLDAAKVKSIAVIGRYANEVCLDWYSGTPPYTVTPLEGIRARAGAGAKVDFAADNTDGAAAKLARESEVAIVCVGNHPTGDAGWEKSARDDYGKEAVDRKSISLPDEELIKQVFAANRRTIVVLVSSFPYAINWTQENIPAILHLTHGSQELGRGLADVLFGDVNPAGRLGQTWPKSLDQLPPMMDYDLRHGRTYQYFKGEPLYPFGFGLSYTTFRYTKLAVNGKTVAPDGAVDVTVTVKNSGARDGEEVVQLYAEFPASKVERPQRALCGFVRVPVAAGREAQVTLRVPAASLAYWNVAQHAWTVEPGPVRLRVGGSSADLARTATVTVTAPRN
ncbi:MAG TPA: glycoside hydrolase family 3 C-terminal domain-containing protein [Opitutaceae bacterium]|nr:glycoside hydrolase family 3 C-terminal domain-containing protein [Opitutaceae bacterium]